MFAALSKFIYRRRISVLMAGLVFMIVAGVFGTSVFGSLKGGGFDDPASESSQAQQIIAQQLGRDNAQLIVLFSSSSLNAKDPAYQKAVEATLAKLQGYNYINGINTFYTTGASSFISNDGKSTYATVGLKGTVNEQQKHVKELRPVLTSDSLQVKLGGSAAVNTEVSDQVTKDIAFAEEISLPILSVLLILVFGSLIAAALPLAIGGLSILGSFLILNIIASLTDVSIFAVNVVTILGLGLAIDYSLFVVSRFREELVRQNGDVAGALSKTMQTAGRTVVFSGLTVAISLLGLMVFPQMFLRSMGMGGAAAVVVAMLGSITVLPAILALLGRRVNSLSVLSLIRRNRPAQTAANTQSGFWYQISHFVMRRPIAVIIVTLVPLVVLGSPFLRADFSTPDARSLPEGKESRIVSESLTNDFPRNETSPIQLVVRTTGPALNSENIAALYDYSRTIAQVKGVTRVDSLVTLNPSLDKAAYQNFYSEASRAQNPQAAQAAGRFAKDSYTVLSVLYNSDTLSSEAQDAVRTIRAIPAPTGASVQVGGISAALVDFLASLGRTVPVAFGLIVAVIFVLLFLMLGSVIVPLKAVLLNILSLSAMFGALVWVFQDGNLAGFLNFTPLGTIDGTQPILIFAIAFGLSMDYEVFLLSRIKEQYDRTGDMSESIAGAVQKTGGIITSAAALLVIVTASFITAEIVFIKQIGVGLSLAVLIDATIVRLLLVPATMRLLGKYNWWSPAPLAWVYRKVGLSDVEHDDTPTTAPEPAPAQL